MEYVKTSLAPKRNDITHVIRRWGCFCDLLDIVKQSLDWDEALLLVIHLDAFGLAIDIARNLKCQRLA